MRSRVVSLFVVKAITVAGLIVCVWFFLALPSGPVLTPYPQGPLTTDHVVKGAFHVHTNRSDGSGSVEEVAAAARSAGLQFVIFTDHGNGTRTPVR